MNVRIPKGKYVLAVSGGVDSMALLDLLAKQRDLELIVTHFNHGIRPDSREDEEFVRKTAEKYRLAFEAGYGKLGSSASEEQAREARYKFLNQARQKHQADAIVTAHHQDDLIETAILNIMRGSGRRGLTAITENPDILRPMLHLSKNDILAYAKKHHLQWREDPTNVDERYLRNYIRRRIMPKLDDGQRQLFLRGLDRMVVANRVINQEIAKLSQKLVQGKRIERAGFIALPTEVASEVLMHFLRQNNIREFDRKAVGRLVVAIKTAKAGTKHDVIKGVSLEMTRTSALLKTDVNS